MVADAKDHHRHETEKVHVKMCWLVDHQLWLECHGHSEQHTSGKPRKTRFDEPPDKRVHQLVFLDLEMTLHAKRRVRITLEVVITWLH